LRERVVLGGFVGVADVGALFSGGISGGDVLCVGQETGRKGFFFEKKK
jgi:hypothetical protein